MNGAKIRLIAEHADPVRNALKKSIDAEKVVSDFLSNHFSSNITTQEARDWAKVHITFDSSHLDTALKVIYAEGYTLGEDIAYAALATKLIIKAPTAQQMTRASQINWKDWKPGNRAAANLVSPKGGLSKLIANRGVTIQGIRGTTLDRIGTQLAYALQKGLPPSTVSGTIADLIGAPSEARAGYLLQLGYDAVTAVTTDYERALMIAQTEMSSAVSVANRDIYESSGVEQVEWLTADPCDICQENEDVSPIGIDETFPSGDTEPPAHPNCVCDIAPYVVEMSPAEE